jgi:hypothetical protein
MKIKMIMRFLEENLKVNEEILKRLITRLQITKINSDKMAAKRTEIQNKLSSILMILPILTNRSFKYHLINLDRILARLLTAGMRMNISRSKFSAKQTQYLRYWITRQGIRYKRNKSQAILNMKASKTRKED